MNLQEEIEEATSYSIRRDTDRIATAFMDRVMYQGARKGTESMADGVLPEFVLALDIDMIFEVL